MWSFIKIGLTVSEEMSFKSIVDDAQRTTHAGRRRRPVTIAHHEHFVLRWADNVSSEICIISVRHARKAVEKSRNGKLIFIINIQIYAVQIYYVLKRKSWMSNDTSYCTFLMHYSIKWLLQDHFRVKATPLCLYFIWKILGILLSNIQQTKTFSWWNHSCIRCLTEIPLLFVYGNNI